MHWPPRDTWQTDLGQVQPAWLEVLLPTDLFRVTFSPQHQLQSLSPNCQCLSPPHRVPKRGHTLSRQLNHSGQASLSTPSRGIH